MLAACHAVAQERRRALASLRSRVGSTESRPTAGYGGARTCPEPSRRTNVRGYGREVHGSVPERFASFEGVFDSFEGLGFPAQAEEGLSFEVEDIGFRDKMSPAEVAAAEDVGD